MTTRKHHLTAIQKRDFILRKLLLTVMSIILILVTWHFMTLVAQYIFFSAERFFIECFAADSSWDPYTIEAYDKSIASQMAFVETSDVGNFLYHCGFSVTGKLIRTTLVVMSLPVFLHAVYTVLKSTTILIKMLVRKINKITAILC